MGRIRFFPGPFPFDVPAGPGPADGSTGSLLVPLNVLVRWYYRVKSWDVGFSRLDATVTYDLSSAYGTAATDQIRFDGAASGGIFQAQCDETGMPGLLLLPSTPDLLLQGTGSVGGNGVYTQTGPAIDPTLTYHFTVENDPDNSFWNPFGAGNGGYITMSYDPTTRLFQLRPRVALSATLKIFRDTTPTRAGGQIGQFFVGIINTEFGPGAFTTPQDTTAMIDGYPFTVSLGLEYGQGGSVPAALKIDQDIVVTMTPSKFWEYQDANGVSLWDPGSGEPAINPATGAAFTLDEIAAASLS